MFGSPNSFSNKMPKIQNNWNVFVARPSQILWLDQVVEWVRIVEAEDEEVGSGSSPLPFFL